MLAAPFLASSAAIQENFFPAYPLRCPNPSKPALLAGSAG